MGSLVLCLLAPLLEIEIFKTIPSITEIPIQSFSDSVAESQNIDEVTYKNVETVSPSASIWIYIYLAISLFLVFRFLKNSFEIYQLTKGKHKRIGKLKIIKNNDSELVSSFFNYMFISENQVLNTEDFESIIKHETVHFEEKHTLDIIMIELIICAFWFNPFVWLYKKAVLQNHEYIADDKSVSSGIDIENYSNTIINLGHKEYRIPLTSGFNFIQIKNRIIMLHQSKSSVLKQTLKITSVILLFAGIFVFSSYKDLKAPLVVVLDVGHGGIDPGNLSDSILEKDVVLNISNLLASLSDENVEIILTRHEDEFLELSERAEFINIKNPDLFLSLHSNAHHDESISGTEAYYNSENEHSDISLKYANILVEHQKNYFSSRGIKKANLYLLRNTSVPGVYLELGFMTNKSDRVVLTDKDQQIKIAQSIYDGLLEIRNNK